MRAPIQKLRYRVTIEYNEKAHYIDQGMVVTKCFNSRAAMLVYAVKNTKQPTCSYKVLEVIAYRNLKHLIE